MFIIYNFERNSIQCIFLLNDGTCKILTCCYRTDEDYNPNDENDSEEEEESNEDKNEAVETPKRGTKRGRPPKPLHKCGPTQKRQKIQHPMDVIRESATDLGSSFHQLLYECAKAEAFAKGDYELGMFFKNLIDPKTLPDEDKMTPIKAIYLK